MSRLSKVIGYSLSRPLAYLVVFLVFVAVVVSIIGHWPWWSILASIGAGVVLFGLLVLDSLTDPNFDGDICIADIDIGRIRDKALRSQVRSALEYIRAAQKLVREDQVGALGSADDELPQMEQAARSIYQMALRLQDFRSDPLIARDLARLQLLKARPSRLDDDIAEQMASLRRLDDLATNAEQEINSAVAKLGSTYAQMQAIRVTPTLRGQAVDSFRELGESSKRLSDLADGYDQAYGSRAQPAGPKARG